MKRLCKKFKRLARSRDLKFAFGLGRPGAVTSLRWKGRRIFYRANTSDRAQIERLLLLGRRCEYNLPSKLNPEYVLDAGANIGLAAIYFAELFPKAKIVCCEPGESNLELLRKNTSQLPNVAVLPCALGNKPSRGRMVQRSSRNYARAHVEEGASGEVAIYDYNKLAEVSGIPFFDLIKVDIEGSEFGFLSSMREAQLAHCNWIVGEVHGVDEWKLLDLLSRQFSIDIKKTMGKSASKFHACNLAKVESLLQGFDVSILQM